jgi:hypothetical protein
MAVDDLTRTYKGQVYHRVNSYPYTRSDGSQTKLVEWAGVCAVCGADFLTLAPLRCSLANFKPNTKCKDHRKKQKGVGNGEAKGNEPQDRHP